MKRRTTVSRGVLAGLVVLAVAAAGLAASRAEAQAEGEAPARAEPRAPDTTRWVRFYPDELEAFAEALFGRVQVIPFDSVDPAARTLDMAGRLQLGDEVRLMFFTAPPSFGGILYVDVRRDAYPTVRVRGEGAAFDSAAAVFREHWLRTLLPIDSTLRVRVTEHRAGRGRTPELGLSVGTLRDYSCLGYGVEGDVDRAGDTLHLRLLGVSAPRGLCSQAIGPASGRWPLPDTSGRYRLRISYGDRTDAYDYVVTDTTVRLVPRATGFTERAGPDPRFRSRPQTFAYRCDSPEPTAYICDRVLGWLRARPGLEPLRFPDGVGLPFRRAGPDAHYFRYTPDAMDAVERCFTDVLAEGVRKSVGVSLTIETWDGRLITAWSERSYDEPNSAPHPRLIEACSGGDAG